MRFSGLVLDLGLSLSVDLVEERVVNILSNSCLDIFS